MKRLALTLAVLIGFAIFAIPLAGALAQADWGRVSDVFREDRTIEAVRVSLVVATIAAGVAAIVGAPLAWAFARGFTGRALVRGITLAPLVLAPPVAGIALIAALGPDGLLAPLLDAFDVFLPGTYAAAVIAQAFVAGPFFVLAAEAGFRRVDPALHGAAASLGGAGWFRFRTVTLPIARGALAAGFLLAWVRALGEFGATLAFVGASSASANTLPNHVWQRFSGDASGALAIGIPMIAVAVVVLVAARRMLFGADR